MTNAVIDSPTGSLGLSWDGDVLIGVDLQPQGLVGSSAQPPVAVMDQLRRYFADGHAGFDLETRVGGTPFQRRVWAAMRLIPPGQTRTYGDIARELGSAPRAVGQACRANPVPIVVPCHRVVAATGIGGFAGDTSGHRLAVKRWLLRHEGVHVAD